MVSGYQLSTQGFSYLFFIRSQIRFWQVIQSIKYVPNWSLCIPFRCLFHFHSTLIVCVILLKRFLTFSSSFYYFVKEKLVRHVWNWLYWYVIFLQNTSIKMKNRNKVDYDSAYAESVLEVEWKLCSSVWEVKDSNVVTFWIIRFILRSKKQKKQKTKFDWWLLYFVNS